MILGRFVSSCALLLTVSSLAYGQATKLGEVVPLVEGGLRALAGDKAGRELLGALGAAKSGNGVTLQEGTGVKGNIRESGAVAAEFIAKIESSTDPAVIRLRNMLSKSVYGRDISDPAISRQAQADLATSILEAEQAIPAVNLANSTARSSTLHRLQARQTRVVETPKTEISPVDNNPIDAEIVAQAVLRANRGQIEKGMVDDAFSVQDFWGEGIRDCVLGWGDEAVGNTLALGAQMRGVAQAEMFPTLVNNYGKMFGVSHADATRNVCALAGFEGSGCRLFGPRIAAKCG